MEIAMLPGFKAPKHPRGAHAVRPYTVNTL
jgi:hypothetical protein